MDKKPLSELDARVQVAKQQIPPNSRWQHYKGGKYVVLDIVVIERTLELAVIYRSLEHPTFSFMRPLVEWQDGVEYEGNKVYRFRSLQSE